MTLKNYIDWVSNKAIQAKDLNEAIDLMQEVKDAAIQDNEISVDEVIVIRKLTDMYCDIFTGLFLKQFNVEYPYRHITLS